MGRDPHPIPPGERGTVVDVRHVLGYWHVAVKWDCGRTLSLVGHIDLWVVCSEERAEM